ncbi:MAG: hypothetical protein E6J28_11210 [Chloroflexi bacterium]|nr:MAG: hypothetical protein E6J28_11210 [Chloroflexota bacterium]
MRRALVVLVILTVACSGPAGKPVASTSPNGSPAASASPVKLSTGGIVEYTVPPPAVKPADCFTPCLPSVGSVALGGDGNIWFVDHNFKTVGRITPAGDVKQWSAGLDLIGGAQTIATGPDGNLYVNADGGGDGRPDWILRVTPAGVITRLSAGQRPPGQGVFGTGPESITAGPDGNMWFTEFWTNRVGRLSPSGSLTEFSIPTNDSAPRGIATGPDGNLWFVESTRSRPAIARITPAGVITEFPIAGGDSELYPYDIVSGPDGNIWFTESHGIARITVKGEISPISLPQGSRPVKLVVAPDGNLWYADAGKNAIVRLALSGATRAYPLPEPASNPVGMAVGSDGRIWFSESNNRGLASIGVRVPELLMSTRPLVFADASPKTVSLRNVGNSPLVISAVRITGLDAALIAKGKDTCSATSLAPDASCEVQLRYVGGGPSGLQSAVLELSDNGTGSPHRISLVAQVPRCTLPVMVGGNENTPAQGELFDVRTAQILYDTSGVFVHDPVASGVRTSAPPGLPGMSAGYYDRAMGRWLPVSGAGQVSPDGSRYAYIPVEPIPRTEVRVVDVQSGREKVWKIRPDFWDVMAFTQRGIYLHAGYEGIGAGLYLLDPDSGAFKALFTDFAVSVVDGDAAWLMYRNPADKLPDVSAMGGATNEVRRRDLATGKTDVWLYRPGTNIGVVATANGKPIVSIYDGPTSSYWIMSAPNQVQRMDFPFTSARYAYLRGFSGDANGVWVGSDEGVYLWTQRTGGVLMTDQAATPAGTCA